MIWAWASRAIRRRRTSALPYSRRAWTQNRRLYATIPATTARAHCQANRTSKTYHPTAMNTAAQAAAAHRTCVNHPSRRNSSSSASESVGLGGGLRLTRCALGNDTVSRPACGALKRPHGHAKAKRDHATPACAARGYFLASSSDTRSATTESSPDPAAAAAPPVDSAGASAGAPSAAALRTIMTSRIIHTPKAISRPPAMIHTRQRARACVACPPAPQCRDALWPTRQPARPAVGTRPSRRTACCLCRTKSRPPAR